jgi:hypothetical protein
MNMSRFDLGNEGLLAYGGHQLLKLNTKTRQKIINRLSTKAGKVQRVHLVIIGLGLDVAAGA